MIVCRGILRRTEDAAVAFALFGYLLLDSGFAGAEAVIGTDVVPLLIFDHHIARTPALSIKHLVPCQTHQYTFGDIVVGIVNPSKLLIDFIGKSLGLFKLFQEVVGTHINLLHYHPFL